MEERKGLAVNSLLFCGSDRIHDEGRDKTVGRQHGVRAEEVRDYNLQRLVQVEKYKTRPQTGRQSYSSSFT